VEASLPLLAEGNSGPKITVKEVLVMGVGEPLADLLGEKQVRRGVTHEHPSQVGPP
jgi:hypothetical protein